MFLHMRVSILLEVLGCIFRQHRYKFYSRALSFNLQPASQTLLLVVTIVRAAYYILACTYTHTHI